MKSELKTAARALGLMFARMLGRRLATRARARVRAAVKSAGSSRSGTLPAVSLESLRGRGTRKKVLKIRHRDGRPVEIMVTTSPTRITVRTRREFDGAAVPENDLGADVRNGQLFFSCDYLHFPKKIVQFTKLLEAVIFSDSRPIFADDAEPVEAPKKKRRGRPRKKAENASPDPGDDSFPAGE